MPYNYQEQREALFTDTGQRMFISIRSSVLSHLKHSGAVRMQEALSGFSGDSWDLLACVDRMLELGELREVPQEGVPAQHRIFTGGR